MINVYYTKRKFKPKMIWFSMISFDYLRAWQYFRSMLCQLSYPYLTPQNSNCLGMKALYIHYIHNNLRRWRCIGNGYLGYAAMTKSYMHYTRATFGKFCSEWNWHLKHYCVLTLFHTGSGRYVTTRGGTQCARTNI